MPAVSRVVAAIRRSGVRGRSTAAAIVVVAGALAIGAGVLLLLLQRALITSVADQAESRALDVSSQIQEQGEDGLSNELVENTRPSQVIQVVDQNGRVVATSSLRYDKVPLSGLRPPTGQVARDDAGEMPLLDDDTAYLVIARGTDYQGARYTVVVAASVEAQRDTVSTVTTYLLIGFPLLLLLVGGATWVLVGRALRPVEQIRSRVHGIGVGQLADRVPVPAADDEIARLAVTMNEMLDRLQAGQETQRRFVADASHELRSPIASLVAALEVIVADSTGQSGQELHRVMQAETERMRRLVEDLLLLAKADDTGLRLQRADVDLDDLVGNELRRLRAAGGPEVEGVVPPVRVSGDAAKLSQVIRNLADNAVQAAHSKVSFTLAEYDGQATLQVDDDGDGIPESERDRVFERFVRLDASRDRRSGGSGLGLSIVQEVVRGHGGTVAITESPLGGARFVVTLPVRGPSPPATIG
ncbi:signal transduction histidine kinase [Kribbella sp. VKM Ac-2527]|uniref:histidine kinase n=1 Tax=Kribbella caucasensis TaxID=2512215 RepID=A0A4R6KLT4_9ACTN|nr:HAMP domain-containing sensor histidine kinase [Kribbella sp. VKM Ac-2527]TDO51756.1 signal transduction histidine kinase [Kribbella sp. VKM Ac-2527]